MATTLTGRGIPAAARTQRAATRQHVALADPLMAMLACTARWRERLSERRELLAMDERALRDVGITRCEALAAVQRPWWKA